MVFTIDDNKTIEFIYDLLKSQCKCKSDLEWYENELTIYENKESIEINSCLNEPDWLYDFIYEIFNVIKFFN